MTRVRKIQITVPDFYLDEGTDVADLSLEDVIALGDWIDFGVEEIGDEDEKQ